jgi:hypothetical protein
MDSSRRARKHDSLRFGPDVLARFWSGCCLLPTQNYREPVLAVTLSARQNETRGYGKLLERQQA